MCYQITPERRWTNLHSYAHYSSQYCVLLLKNKHTQKNGTHFNRKEVVTHFVPPSPSHGNWKWYFFVPELGWPLTLGTFDQTWTELPNRNWLYGGGPSGSELRVWDRLLWDAQWPFQCGLKGGKRNYSSVVWPVRQSDSYQMPSSKRNGGSQIWLAPIIPEALPQGMRAPSRVSDLTGTRHWASGSSISLWNFPPGESIIPD